MLSIPPQLATAVAAAAQSCHYDTPLPHAAAAACRSRCLKLKLLCELELQHLPLFLSLFSSSSHAQVGQGIRPGAACRRPVSPNAPLTSSSRCALQTKQYRRRRPLASGNLGQQEHHGPDFHALPALTTTDNAATHCTTHTHRYTHYSVIHIEEEENQGTTSHKHRARFLSLDGLHSRWDASIFIENL